MSSMLSGLAGMAGTAVRAQASVDAPHAGCVPWSSVSTVTPKAGTGVSGLPSTARRPRPKAASSPPRQPDTYASPSSYLQSVWVRREASGVHLRSPLLHLWVSDEDRDGVFVVTDQFSTVYGAGSNPDAAISDYLENLFLHFDDLDRGVDRLGPALRDELNILRRHLARGI